jgi:PIN domain nuclease of toxin-antitoxin system
VNLLLDTHALLWALAGDPRLGPAAVAAIADRANAVYASAASAWEMAIKVGLGKLDVPPDIGAWLPDELRASGIAPLAVTVEHAAGVEELPRHHADPFDRLLIAQAIAENLVIVTVDRQLAHYGVRLFEPAAPDAGGA